MEMHAARMVKRGGWCFTRKGHARFRVVEKSLKNGKGHPPQTWEVCPFKYRLEILAYSDIYSSRTFLSLLNVEGNPVAFVKAFESTCIDC